MLSLQLLLALSSLALESCLMNGDLGYSVPGVTDKYHPESGIVSRHNLVRHSDNSFTQAIAAVWHLQELLVAVCTSSEATAKLNCTTSKRFSESLLTNYTGFWHTYG